MDSNWSIYHWNDYRLHYNKIKQKNNLEKGKVLLISLIYYLCVCILINNLIYTLRHSDTFYFIIQYSCNETI